MSNTRVRALKGEAKTVSRKARKSGRASGAASPGGSDILQKVFHSDDAPRSEASATPPGTPLRYDSDGGEGDNDEPQQQKDLSFSSADDGHQQGPFDPRKLVSELQDRKPTHVDTRLLLLDHYVRMLRSRYADELEGVDSPGELLGTFVRSADRATSARERSLSLQAYTLTLCLSDAADGTPWRTSLRRILADDDDDECKVQALQALTVSTCAGATAEDDVLDYMDFLVDAVQANGETVSAVGRDAVTVSLLESWGFAATHVGDLWAQADYTMDAFVDKLDSTDVDTQTAAAESIAFIFESSREHEQVEGHPYDLPYDPARLSTRIRDMTKGAAKSMSRRNRRDLREALRSVVTSLDNSVGPYYSTAAATAAAAAAAAASSSSSRDDASTDAHVGYRLKLRKRNASSSYGYSAHVESWHHYLRLTMLRSIFANGLERHIEHDTPFVVDTLDGLDWQLVRKTDTRGGLGAGSTFIFGHDDDDDDE
ncbi:Interferon-related developmental regulator (IFRD) [Geosmithia morbida]|uniref:Interferon-related developmental regulator (IFRD) n=1 Tax=Geosmithia morbida TaxID=1094350 RepID=A0A9P5D1E2_9HYPO|nr:Interferon-related developmental regulator (IFRD) [Geosmithia morbida]KAF4122657.1 Interferon-related developmental regulator (IFRD) [Geosmithia morbida]